MYQGWDSAVKCPQSITVWCFWWYTKSAEASGDVHVAVCRINPSVSVDVANVGKYQGVNNGSK
jgi:hypothetical protein